MKQFISFLSLFLFSYTIGWSQDFTITNAYVTQNASLEQLIFTIEVAGIAGDSLPTPIGMLDGAPVLGYVFPTTLNSYDVGFDTTTGIVALALTAHPDFDDTPIWDENNDANYANDGAIWHSHWVLLVNDTTVAGGLSVKATNSSSILPPTNPGMPMYMDSPGFPVVKSGNKISCTVPLYRMNYQDNFNYDAVTAYMQVNTSNSSLPTLGVYAVYDIASGNLSLPYTVGQYSCDSLFINISQNTGIGLVNSEVITVYPNPSSTNIHLGMSAGLTLGSYEVQIFNISGILVYQNVLNNNNQIIPVSSIGTAGTYLLNIIDSSTGALKGSKKLILN